MPYVIQTGQSAKFGASYYAGPVAAMQMASVSTSRRSDVPRADNINAATRIPVIFRQQAELKAAELRQDGHSARVVYDTPKPLKALKWLFSF